jgi:hypothetical protein
VSVFAEATTVITNERIHVDEVLTGDVFEACWGEGIHVTYDSHHINRVTIDAEGRPHLSYHQNLSNLKAIGLETGTNYTGNQPENFISTGKLHLIFEHSGTRVPRGIPRADRFSFQD